MLAVAISFRIAYPLAVTKCQVNVLLLTLNVNTDLRSRLSSPFVSGIKTIVLSKLCHRPFMSKYNIRMWTTVTLRMIYFTTL